MKPEQHMENINRCRENLQKALSADMTTTVSINVSAIIDSLIVTRLSELLDNLPGTGVGATTTLSALSPLEALQMAAQFAEDQKLFLQPNPNGYFDKGQTPHDEKSRVIQDLANYIRGQSAS